MGTPKSVVIMKIQVDTKRGKHHSEEKGIKDEKNLKDRRTPAENEATSLGPYCGTNDTRPHTHKTEDERETNHEH